MRGEITPQASARTRAFGNHCASESRRLSTRGSLLASQRDKYILHLQLDLYSGEVRLMFCCFWWQFITYAVWKRHETFLPSFMRKLRAVTSSQSPFTANIVPKLVAVATSLRPSISAMSSVDSLSPKTCHVESNSRSYIDSKFTCPTHTPKGQPISEAGGDPLHVWYGRSRLSTDWRYCYKVPDFPALRKGGT